MIKILLSEIVHRRDNRLKELFGQTMGMETALFDTPHQAIKILENDRKIDLVIASPEDIQPAKMDLLNYIKTSARLSWIPVIIIGEAMDENFVNYCLDCGISDILNDSVVGDLLLSRINSAVTNGRRRILVVDDDEIVLKVLTTSLEVERYRVYSARGAEEALEIFKNETIHAVITDIMLRNNNGLDLLVNFKEQAPLTPVIVITGHSGIFTPRDAIAAGADGYFAKPFNNLELIFTLKQIFGFRLYQSPGRHLQSTTTGSAY